MEAAFLLKSRPGLRFGVLFLSLFALFYAGFFALLGLSSPGNFYSPFVHNYFDVIHWMRQALISATEWFCSLFGYETERGLSYLLRFKNGRGVVIARDCLGFGIYSFWAAFVIASHRQIKSTIAWLMGGLFALWLLNVLRISLLLIAINTSGKSTLFGMDHHTLFNIVAYGFIFFMIYLYSRKK